MARGGPPQVVGLSGVEPLARPRLRVLIVDDEPPARRLLRKMLDSWPDLEVVGELGDSRQAIAAVVREAPDILFLDIEMPGIDGFGVVAGLPPDRLPQIVFVTAHAEHALRAFEVSAVDYLLKPFDERRLAATLGRVLEKARRDTARAPGDGEPRAGYPRHLAVRSEDGERFVLLAVEKIHWLEAAAKWVRVYGAGETWVVKGPLQKIEEILDPERFLRISRSAIVGLEHIREIQPWFGGDFVVLLERDKRLRSSETYREVVRDLIANRRR